MGRRGILLFALLFATGVAATAGDVPWHHPLSYANGGYWPLRVPVTITAAPDAPAPENGTLVEVKLSDEALAPLVGQPVESLRAVTADGAELLFDVPRWNLDADATVFIPYEANPDGGPAVVYLYAGNEKAWHVADWLPSGLKNRGFEGGSDDSPYGWSASMVDDTHTMSLDGKVKGGDERCARCDVAPGAEATWVQYGQSGIPLQPGAHYRFSAWVKGEGVVGKAGWFLHVNGDRPQMINRVEGWDGTFDWREVVIEFDVPEGGHTLACGTVLYGTGTAWYDDVKLERIGGALLTATPGPAERRDLAPVQDDGAWPDDATRQWRAPIIARNFTDSDVTNSVVFLDTRRIYNAMVKQIGFEKTPSLRIVDADGAVVPAAGALKTDLACPVSVPARSEKRLWLYLSADATAGQPESMASWASMSMNLLQNGSMEEGADDSAPGWLTGEEGRDHADRFTARRVEGGVDGGHALELTVPASVENPNWVGWRQRVPVKPLTQYLLAGWIRSQGLDVDGRIHYHFHRADGSLTEQPFGGTGSGVKGDSDWTRTEAAFTTPAECASVEVHLTMNGHGTLWHDAVTLVERNEAVCGPFEARTPAEGLQAWTVNPLVKVFPDDIPPANPQHEIHLCAARGTTQSYPIAVWSPLAFEEDYLGWGSLIGPDGFELHGYVSYVENVPVDFPIGYDNTKQPPYRRLLPKNRGCDGWPGMWPDEITGYMFEGLVVSPGETEVVLRTLEVPRNAPPGDYTNTFTVGDVVFTETVTVWPFTVPEEKHVTAIYDLRGGPGWNIFDERSDEFGMSVDSWYSFLHNYNVSPGLIIADPVFSYENGKVSMDTTEFDEQAEELLDHGKATAFYSPHVFYASGWAYPPQKFLGLEPFTPEYVAAWKEAYRLYIDHLTERGWRDRVVLYISDEPFADSAQTIEGIARIAGMAREVAPDVPVYSSTWHYIDGLAGHVNLWGAGPHGSFDAERMAERRAAGDRFWFTTDGQMCLDTPYLAIERLLPWFCLKHDVDGYEFWGVSWWTHDPGSYGWHKYIRQSNEGEDYYWVRYPNGDGYLTYPGCVDLMYEINASIRLVAAREGVDDYEIFRELKRYADEGNAEARAALDKVFALVNMPNAGGRYSTEIMPNPDAVQAARIEAGETLARLMQQ